MSVLTDLAAISVLSSKAVRITVSAAKTTVLVDPTGDESGETQITLTGAQQLAILANRAPLIAQIKALAAGLP